MIGIAHGKEFSKLNEEEATVLLKDIFRREGLSGRNHRRVITLLYNSNAHVRDITGLGKRVFDSVASQPPPSSKKTKTQEEIRHELNLREFYQILHRFEIYTGMRSGEEFAEQARGILEETLKPFVLKDSLLAKRVSLTINQLLNRHTLTGDEQRAIFHQYVSAIKPYLDISADATNEAISKMRIEAGLRKSGRTATSVILDVLKELEDPKTVEEIKGKVEMPGYRPVLTI